jgi:hypothetical protein
MPLQDKNRDGLLSKNEFLVMKSIIIIIVIVIIKV